MHSANGSKKRQHLARRSERSHFLSTEERKQHRMKRFTNHVRLVMQQQRERIEEDRKR